MLLDSLVHAWSIGGWIMWPIFAVGFMAFYLVLMTFFVNGRDLYFVSEQKLGKQVLEAYHQQGRKGALDFLSSKKGLAAATLRIPFEHPNLSEFGLRELIREKWHGVSRGLDRGLHLIGIMGTTVPLLGLLGTVEGMMKTFEVISVYGNSNPALLSRGISEALIAVQSGLLVAAPILLLHQRLLSRVESLKNQIALSMQEIVFALHPKGDE